MNEYFDAWKKYAKLHGRSTRREFFSFLGIHVLILFVLMGLGATAADESGTAADMGLPARLYFIASFLPALAVTVRRLHDTGRTGWWVLVSLIPLLGPLGLLALTLLKTEAGAENRYGVSPHPGLPDD